MCKATGYKPKTTFWQDFSIAECFGKDAIKNTFKRAFNEWKSNHVYLTELVMILNWKLWSWESENRELSRLYNEFYEKADQYAIENLKGEELNYYLETTD